MEKQNANIRETLHDLQCNVNEKVNSSTPTSGWDPNKPIEQPQRFRFCIMCQMHGHDRMHCWETRYKQEAEARNEIGQKYHGIDFPEDVSPGYKDPIERNAYKTQQEMDIIFQDKLIIIKIIGFHHQEIIRC